jgi:hypothetical protein
MTSMSNALAKMQTENERLRKDNRSLKVMVVAQVAVAVAFFITAAYMGVSECP